jgi:hypothetical protein
LVASATDLDQPLSYEFTRKLFLELNKQLKEEQKQQQAYENLLASLKDPAHDHVEEGGIEQSINEVRKDLDEVGVGMVLGFSCVTCCLFVCLFLVFPLASSGVADLTQ